MTKLQFTVAVLLLFLTIGDGSSPSIKEKSGLVSDGMDRTPNSALFGLHLPMMTVICYSVKTDIETKYSASIMLFSMVPFLILQLAEILSSAIATRVIVLVSLITALALLISYCTYIRYLSHGYRT
ncbi:hypothetical protein GOBAR_AA13542 [Gossypium barbadense]|uniref:PGG domain-containing protein n=1 Tax=Gossypium barbadense TaxID=3634 RepID=A0A2P5XUR5_GOSBA|nr:hypothetical protein GOBAR_AA13542 [Gossypium barbadense]